MNDDIDLVDAIRLLDGPSRKHGDAGNAGGSDAAGEDRGASGARATSQDNMSHDGGTLEWRIMMLEANIGAAYGGKTEGFST